MPAPPPPPQLSPEMLAFLATQDRGLQLAGVMITGLVLSLIVITARFYTRLVIVRVTGVDDWFALISFVFLIVAFSLLGSSIIYGLGRHAANLEMERTIYAMKLVWMAFQFTPTAEATGKISVAFLLMRITTSKKLKWFFYILIGINIGINIGMMFSILMTCWPVRMLWDPRVQGHCNIFQRNVMTYFQGGSAAITDLILAIAPIPLLWNVKTSKKTKWLLCGLLSIGLFTAGAGFTRIGFSYQTYSAETQMDPTWGLMDFIIWKCVELSLSVIVGCLPTLRPLFDGRSWTRIGYTGASNSKKHSGGASPNGSGISASKEKMQIHKSNEIQMQWSERSLSGSRDGTSTHMTSTVHGPEQV